MSLEVAILAPALILLIVAGIFAGRTVLAANMVAAAAHDSARAASLARNASGAQVAARRSADISLSGHAYTCATHDITVNTGGFNAPLGQPASVTVRVTCTISYADLLKIPGIPGEREITDAFTSPLDQFRQKS